ncbi:MAG: aminoacyl-tRNA hydrolase [Lentisphaeria bacterium]|nr:aminoacyl-tRNA hydrolase [Lentisphaeria bacterium]
MAEILENYRLIVGLGNPGAEYRNTRHNAGFMVIEKLLEGPFKSFEESHTADSRVFSGRFRGRSLMLQMPLTYMNDSGRAVGALSRRLNIAPSEILVISDDLDLPLGQLRIRKNGSDGGHNGLKSIIAELQSAEFRRLRIGIGRDGRVIDHVLSAFTADEQPVWDEAVKSGADAVTEILKAGLARAMNHYNTRPRAEKEKSENTPSEVSAPADNETKNN